MVRLWLSVSDCPALTGDVKSDQRTLDSENSV